MQNKIKALLILMIVTVSMARAPVHAATKPLAVTFGGNTFLLPFQKLDVTQLYSFRDGKGYPGLHTVLASRGKLELTFGAAPVLNTSQNVPFLALQTQLSDKFFDTSNNSLRFGIWIGKQSDQKRATYGILASQPLW